MVIFNNLLRIVTAILPVAAFAARFAGDRQVLDGIDAPTITDLGGCVVALAVMAAFVWILVGPDNFRQPR